MRLQSLLYETCRTAEVLPNKVLTLCGRATTAQPTRTHRHATDAALGHGTTLPDDPPPTAAKDYVHPTYRTSPCAQGTAHTCDARTLRHAVRQRARARPCRASRSQPAPRSRLATALAASRAARCRPRSASAACTASRSRSLTPPWPWPPP